MIRFVYFWHSGEVFGVVVELWKRWVEISWGDFCWVRRYWMCSLSFLKESSGGVLVLSSEVRLMRVEVSRASISPGSFRYSFIPLAFSSSSF